MPAIRLYLVPLYWLIMCRFVHAEPLDQHLEPVEQQPVQESVQVQFESHPSGIYHIGHVYDDWQFVPWVALYDRAHIVHDEQQGKTLQIAYPQNTVGPKQGGGQFEVSLRPADAYWLSYKVKFNEGFDFRLGGKLPGLTSGGETFTGGNKPVNGEGWSARFMWTQGGTAVVYLYYVDMKGEWGDGLPLKDFKFIPGRWYQLTQYIQLNTESKKNGRLMVWVDDEKLLDREDIRFRLENKGLIDNMYFSTFHGGASQEWAPLQDSFAQFDDFLVSRESLEP